MNIEEITDHASAWQNEDKERRAIMVIAVTVIEKTEEEIKTDTVGQIEGNGELCRAAMRAILKDNSESNALGAIMKRAHTEVAIEKLINVIGGN